MTTAKDTALEAVRTILSRREAQPTADPKLRPSAVLLLVYKKDGEYCVMFNKRSEEVEFNKGDMCFPGGGKNPEDASLVAAALREANEEMGIKPEDVTVLGELNHTAARTDFFIRPFVATIPQPYTFKPNSIEVAEVVEIPIAQLLDRNNLREEIRVLPDGQQVTSLAYAYGRHLIYGATAQILNQFLGLLVKSGWSKGALAP